MNLNLEIETAVPVHLQIEAFLRRKIESGEFCDGFRLPPTSELAKLWHVDCTAIQRAVMPLVAQGIIKRQRGRGTFVQYTPQRATIAILFGICLTKESAHYYRAILRSLRLAMNAYGWDYRLYDGLNEKTKLGQQHLEETFTQLNRDMFNYGFKGQIHVALRENISERLRQESSGPIVGLNHDVLVEANELVRKGSVFLAEKARRKITYIFFSEGQKPVTQNLELLHAAARETGIDSVEIVHVPLEDSVDGYEKQVQEKLTALIADWRIRPEGMPDGLLVPDDIMMRGVALALLASGIQVPQDLEIVVKSNEGVVFHYGVPVTHFEIPVTQIGHEAVARLWKEVLHEPLPREPVVLHGAIKEQGIR